MSTTHSPDPKFVGNLERELRSTLRRQGRFDNGPSTRTGVIRKARWTSGLIALAAMCLGSAGTLAVTQQLRAQMAELIIAKSEARSEFANARLDLYAVKLQEAEEFAAAEILTPREVDLVRFEYAQVQANATARTLDVEESRISERAPENSLAAPILRGRDFVTERLELALLQASLRVKSSTVDKRVPAHWQDLNESSKIAREQKAAQAELSLVQKRLSLRQDFLSGTRTARQVELADMQSSAESQRETAIRRMHELQRQVERIERLVEEGMATRSEARPVEMEFRAALLQLELAELEIRIIDAKLAGPSGE